MKKCPACKESKDLIEFYNNKATKDGKSCYCKPCTKEMQRGVKKKSPGKYKIGRSEYMRQWRADNKGKVKANHQKWVKDNPEKVSAWAKSRYHKEPAVARAKQWKKDNPSKVTASTAKRRANKKKATPAWADNKLIQEFYAEARRLTIESEIIHEVDHIIPLSGKLVSGLHVEENLQVILASENRAKSNAH